MCDYASKNVLIPFLEQATIKVEKLITQFIQERFYDMYSPTTYIRTRKLLDSVAHTDIKKVGQYSYEVIVYLDPSNAYYYNVDRTTGEVFDVDANYVFSLAAEGFHGSSGIQTEGQFWKEAREDLNERRTYDIVADLKQYFISHGIKVE